MFSTIKENIQRRLGIEKVNHQSPKSTALIENPGEFSARFKNWSPNDNLNNYPFVTNRYAPFTPMRRALPMLNLALISSAGAYIDGTEAFDIEAKDGDMTFREIPLSVEAEDLLYAARGYDATAVREDRNVLIPVDRLFEYAASNFIGQLNEVWWSVSSWTPNAHRVAEELAPALAERLAAYEVQAALFVPASRLCHQTMGILARAAELKGIPTMVIAVDKLAVERIRPPRTAYYAGELGATAGKPNWKQYQLRVLDEAIRWIETFDQPGTRKLVVDLETETEESRGER